MKPLGVAAALGLLLAGLAALQYRWLGDVSAAERERMRTNLQTRATDVAQAFDGEITRTFIAFHVDPEQLQSDPQAALAGAYDAWLTASANPALVRAIDVVDSRDLETLRRFTLADRRLAVAPWPPELRTWLDHLRRAVPAANASSPLLLADAIDASIPAVVIAIPNVRTTGSDGKLALIADPAAIATTIVVELDGAVLRDRLLAPLVARYFGSASDYVVTVAERDDPRRIVFASDRAVAVDARSADVTAGLFDLRMDDVNRVVAPAHGAERRSRVAITIVRRSNAADGRRLFAGKAPETAGWKLYARYRTDSLDALVAASRRRNFAIVLAVLLLLGGSVALMMMSAERERRIARQQMEFVAAVSHELRTPLAVIRSAGENLADGLVGDAAQVRRYGAVVQTEGRRLSDMVERVMRFAGMTSGVRTRASAAVDLGAIVRQAAAAVQVDAAEGDVSVSVRANGALPPVLGDADALRSAVQNVIGNAVKYSRAGGVVEVAADANGRGVRIRVADSGIGIDAADLPNVCKPFYRGRRAVDAQIRGSGIGLSLVRSIVDEHGGELRIESRPDAGTTVTIELPERG